MQLLPYLTNKNAINGVLGKSQLLALILPYLLHVQIHKKNNKNCTKSYRIRIKCKRRRFRTWEDFGSLSEPIQSGFSHCHRQQGALAKRYLQNATHFCYFILIQSPTCRLITCLNCSRYKATQGHS